MIEAVHMFANFAMFQWRKFRVYHFCVNQVTTKQKLLICRSLEPRIFSRPVRINFRFGHGFMRRHSAYSRKEFIQKARQTVVIAFLGENGFPLIDSVADELLLLVMW